MTDHAAIEQTAAAWLLRRSEPSWSERDTETLEQWLDESMAHAAAFWRLEFGYEQLDRLHALPQPTAAASRPRISEWMSAWRAPVTALAASVVAAVCLLYFLMSGPPAAAPEAEAYQTNAGQTAHLELADGTRVSLNTDSRIRYIADARGRSLWLERGEAYLEVAHEAARPFRVHAGKGEVTVVGTKFLVTREPGKTNVAVLEGRVRLEQAGNAGTGYLMLTPGEIGSADNRALVLATMDLKRLRAEIAWQTGMVVFDDTSVADAAARFNRYNKRKIVASGARVQRIHIGGTFRLGNIEGFARLMQSAYGLDVDIGDDAITIR